MMTKADEIKMLAEFVEGIQKKWPNSYLASFLSDEMVQWVTRQIREDMGCDAMGYIDSYPNLMWQVESWKQRAEEAERARTSLLREMKQEIECKVLERTKELKEEVGQLRDRLELAKLDEARLVGRHDELVDKLLEEQDTVSRFNDKLTEVENELQAVKVELCDYVREERDRREAEQLRASEDLQEAY